ncbi:MAG: hypothetical protein WC783_00260 [Candidatus Paceibacterota bacterium]|jgi:hypothetical protein
MTIYILTSGCYSDYRIVGVVSSEGKAKSLIASHFCEDYEEYETDNLGEYALKKAALPEYHIIMNLKTGDVDEIVSSDFQSIQPDIEYDNYNKIATPKYMVLTNFYNHINHKRYEVIIAVMQGYDNQEHAIKVLNEKRIQLKLKYPNECLVHRSWYIDIETLEKLVI